MMKKLSTDDKVLPFCHNDKDLIKASAAIQISNQLGLLERKIGNALLRHAFHHLLEREVHTIHLAILAGRVGFDSNNYQALREALTNLAKTTLEWNVLGKDKQPIWGVSSVLSQAIIRDGVLFYAYPPFMRGSLRHPDFYATLNLTVQNAFRSKHALALWEFFTDYLGSKRENCETDFIPLEDFRKLLGMAPDDYVQFKELNRRVIQKPLKEISQGSDLMIEGPILKRASRRVVALKFRISRKSPLMLAYSDETGAEEDKASALVERMMNLGFTMRAARTAQRRHERATLEANIRLVEEKVSHGNISAPAALLTAALRDDYAARKGDAAPKGAAHGVVHEAAAMEAARALLQDHYEAFCSRRIKAQLKNLPARQMATLRRAFVERLADDPLLSRQYQKSGLRHPGLRLMFHAFARPQLLERPEERSLTGYIAYACSAPEEVEPSVVAAARRLA